MLANFHRLMTVCLVISFIGTGLTLLAEPLKRYELVETGVKLSVVCLFTFLVALIGAVLCRAQEQKGKEKP